jgi:hypothetical protein
MLGLQASADTAPTIEWEMRMSENRDPANPLQRLIDGAKKIFGSESASTTSHRSPELRNEAQQRDADDRFEAQKAKDAERANR